MTDLPSTLSSIAAIVVVMALVAALEVAIPLHARNRWNSAHLVPNAILTALTFAINLVLGAALIGALDALRGRGYAPLDALGWSPLATGALGVVALDFSFYVAHVAMHRIPSFWRVHRVHHSDPCVDVTTTVRQHPLEGLIRFVFTGAFALALGASPASFGVYRLAVASNALLEHANLRCPARLDRALSLVTTWPHMHKVHHSRVAAQADTNYGNLFSWWDRLFGTFTPSHLGVDVRYGLEGFDEPASQTTGALLAMPWRDAPAAAGAVRRASA